MANQDKKGDLKKISCNKCGSTYGYAKIRTMEWVCRKCGNIQKNN